jgi:hypothetical protein
LAHDRQVLSLIVSLCNILGWRKGVSPNHPLVFRKL